MEPIYEFGIQLIQSLQNLSPALDGVMGLISFIGTIQFYMLLIPLIYWLVDASLGFRVLLVLVSTDLVSASLKQLLHEPRPYWVGDVKPLAEETSYGVPSSHSSDSLAVWGYLAYRIKKGWLWVLSTVIILLIGLSRMYLGVHFPQDVLVGWLVGLVVLVLFVWLEARVAAWFKGFSTGGQIGIGFVISLLMILVGWLIGLIISSSPDPAEWSRAQGSLLRTRADEDEPGSVLRQPGRQPLTSPPSRGYFPGEVEGAGGRASARTPARAVPCRRETGSSAVATGRLPRFSARPARRGARRFPG